MLFICDISTFIYKGSSDFNELFKVIKKKGILKYLKNIKDFLESIFKIIKLVFKNLGKTFISLTELLGYISIFVPIITIIKDILINSISTYPGAINTIGFGIGLLSVKEISLYIVEKIKENQ